MNYLKSKFLPFSKNASSKVDNPKSESVQKKQPKQVKPTPPSPTKQLPAELQLYQRLKEWDVERTRTLKRHLEVIEQILQHQATRVRNSQHYMLALEAILIGRLKQLEKYNKNSINGSAFVLSKSHSEAYQPHHDLLKGLVMYESQKEEAFNSKYYRLKQIFSELCSFKKADDEEVSSRLSISPKKKNSKGSQQRITSSTSIEGAHQIEEGSADLDESSVVILKSDVRYLIDCELPDINEEILRLSSQISGFFSQKSEPKEDLLICLEKFFHCVQLQVQKHREIGRQVLSLNRDFVEREKGRSERVKQTLKKWVEEDQAGSAAMAKQLEKSSDQTLIEDYYYLPDMVEDPEHVSTVAAFSASQTVCQNRLEGAEVKLQPCEPPLLESYLVNVALNPFDMELLKPIIKYRCSVFYNKKIETEIILTSSRHFHLRKVGHLQPEFSFTIESDNREVQVEELGEFVVQVSKFERKKLIPGAKQGEKEFEFLLEFNLVEDLSEFREAMVEVVSPGKYKQAAHNE